VAVTNECPLMSECRRDTPQNHLDKTRGGNGGRGRQLQPVQLPRRRRAAGGVPTSADDLHITGSPGGALGFGGRFPEPARSPAAFQRQSPGFGAGPSPFQGECSIQKDFSEARSSQVSRQTLCVVAASSHLLEDVPRDVPASRNQRADAKLTRALLIVRVVMLAKLAEH